MWGKNPTTAHEVFLGTNVNLSRSRTGKVRDTLQTLDMICEGLDCQPGNVLKHVPIRGAERNP